MRQTSESEAAAAWWQTWYACKLTILRLYLTVTIGDQCRNARSNQHDPNLGQNAQVNLDLGIFGMRDSTESAILCDSREAGMAVR